MSNPYNGRANRLLTVFSVALLAFGIALFLGVIVAAAYDSGNATEVDSTEIEVNHSSEFVDVELEATDSLSSETDVRVFVNDAAGEEVTNKTETLAAGENASIEFDVADDVDDLEGNETWTVQTMADGDDTNINVADVSVDHGGGFTLPLIGGADSGTATAIGAVILVGLVGALYARD